MRVENLQRHHFSLLELQERQSFFDELMHDSNYKDFLVNSSAYSLVDDLNCYGMAGVIDMGFGRGQAWSLFSKNAGKHMVRITRAVKDYLNSVDYNRIEMHVEKDFDEARRWAKMLGFEYESEMPQFLNGKDYYMFVRIK